MWQERENSSVGYNEEMFGEPSSPVRQEPEQEPPCPRAAAGDAQALLARQLAPGERLLWSGSPKKLHGPRGAGKLFTRFLGAAFVALVTLLIFATGIGVNSDKAIIGALMPLVPGMALTLGIRDLIDSDFLSGVIRMLDALLTAACIAMGAGLVLAVANLIEGVTL